MRPSSLLLFPHLHLLCPHVLTCHEVVFYGHIFGCPSSCANSGGFLKREGRPKDADVLVARLIDRPLRPMFDKGWSNETQVGCHLSACCRQDEQLRLVRLCSGRLRQDVSWNYRHHIAQGDKQGMLWDCMSGAVLVLGGRSRSRSACPGVAVATAVACLLCVQVLSWVLSYDGLNAPEPLAITAAGAALLVSDVPLKKAVAGVRVGWMPDGSEWHLLRQLW